VTTWREWAAAVLGGIKSPKSEANFATLQGWTAQEKTGLHPSPPLGPWALQWWNPLNTTQPWPGAVDSGAQPGPHDVKIYSSLEDGAAATVTTLLNGNYPGIVAAMRSSRPAVWWEGGARTQLDTWGTGQVWLGFVPLTGDVMATIDEIYNMLRTGKTSTGLQCALAKTTDVTALTKAVNELKTAVANLPAGGGLTAAQAKQLTDALTGVTTIEAQLKAGLKAV
jgi:hypothetical protein